jgi:NAD(P)-dependent dehydrogenase (short-subunit alcohol dehydrogenase family)/SAM-dependent methyltransferase
MLRTFRLVRALARVQAETELGLCAVVASADAEAGGLSGFVRAVAKEYPRWRVSSVEVESVGTNLGRRLRAEQAGGAEREVRLTASGRYERVLVPLASEAPVGSGFRRGGVYVIVGGGGGIGTALSEYLAGRYGAKLAWLGRRDEDDEVRGRMAAIRARGGEAMYLQADVTEESQVRAAAEAIRSQYGRIDGVVHSALVLADRTLARMDEERFLAAYRVKAAGARNVEQVFGGEPGLAFIIYFSAAQSFAASAGQSNYAAGCTSLDHFAREVRGRGAHAVQVINWGYWGEAGVVSSGDYRRALAERGLHPLSNAEGFAALEHLVATPALAQVMVIKAEEPLLAAMGVDRAWTRRLLRGAAIPVPALPPEEVPATMARVIEEFRALEAHGRACALAALRTLGAFREAREESRCDRLAAKLGIASRYVPWLEAVVAMLVAGGELKVEPDGMLTPAPSGVADGGMTAAGFPALAPHLELLRRCVDEYPHVLRGERSAVDVLFAGANLELIERVHGANPVAEHYGRLQARAIADWVEKRLEQTEQVDVLEIGAGTGGSTGFVLDALRRFGGRVRYHYTDLSRTFLEHGRRRFGDRARYAVLDLEREPGAQGFDPGTMDVVLATNVLHATRRLERSLAHAKQLLRGGGLLALSEITQVQGFALLTFGLTDGWWLFDDAENRLPGGPIVACERWCELLRHAGFNGIAVQGNAGGAAQAVLTASSDGCVRLAAQPAASRPGQAIARREPADTARVPTDARAGEPAAAAERYVRSVFSRVLKIEPADFNSRATFETYGVDSLVVLELTKRFEADLGRLPSTLLFEFPTIEAVSRYLVEKHAEKLATLSGPAAVTPVPPPHPPATQPAPPSSRAALRDRGAEVRMPAIEDLSDDEIDAFVDRLSNNEVSALLSALAPAESNPPAPSRTP